MRRRAPHGHRERHTVFVPDEEIWIAPHTLLTKSATGLEGVRDADLVTTDAGYDDVVKEELGSAPKVLNLEVNP